MRTWVVNFFSYMLIIGSKRNGWKVLFSCFLFGLLFDICIGVIPALDLKAELGERNEGKTGRPGGLFGISFFFWLGTSSSKVIGCPFYYIVMKPISIGVL